MRSIRLLAALLTALCACAAWAAETTSPEFVKLLKETEAQRRAGAIDPQQFIGQVRAIADRGDPSAQFLIAMLAMKQDRELAKDFFSRSAMKGCSGSEMGLAVVAMLEHHTEEGVRRFWAAASKGDVSAYAAIAGMHERGDYEFERSLPKAYAWAKLAADESPSKGARMAMEDAMRRIDSGMSGAQREEAAVAYTDISRRFPKVKYFFCGQFNLDTSLDPTVPSYFQLAR